MINKKASVNWKVCPEIESVQDLIAKVYRVHGGPGAMATVTSAKDGKHSQHSAHHQSPLDKRLAQAIDLRIWNLFRDTNIYMHKEWWEKVEKFGALLVEAVNEETKGGKLAIILEPDHFHLEFFPDGQPPNIVGFKEGKLVYVTDKARERMV